MQPDSLRGRVTLAFTALIAITMLIVCNAAIFYSRITIERESDAVVLTGLEYLQHRLERVDAIDDAAKVDLTRRADRFNKEHAILIDYALYDRERAPLWKIRDTMDVWSDLRSPDWRVLTLDTPQGTLIGVRPWKRAQNIIRRNATVVAGVGLLVVVVTAVGAWVVVGRTLAPIDQLAHQAQAASTDQLDLNLSAPSRDREVVNLVSTLNAMLARLARTVEARGRFHAAASHELRTPVQALSGHLELALMRPRTADEYRAVIEESVQQSQRLMDLIGDLLTLNRIETGAVRPRTESIDLADACQRMLGAASQRIQARRITAVNQLPVDQSIVAPITHLEMLLRNLIENAVKYADEGGTVRLTMNGPTLSIFNSGTTLPPLDTEKLFEAFYRPDAARNSATGGNGLGLAICKAICDANDWTIWMEQTPDGITVRVTFVDRPTLALSA
jgi:signal transduction histidine kinase